MQRRKSNEEGMSDQHAFGSVTDVEVLGNLGVRPIELHGRPCLQCVTCQRAWSLKLQGGRLMSAWWHCPTGCKVPEKAGSRHRARPVKPTRRGKFKARSR